MTEIKFCETNFHQGVEAVIKRLESDGISFEIEPCIGFCGECALHPIAALDGDLIEGETADELYNNIKEGLKK